MKIKTLFLIHIAILFLFSCQEEIDLKSENYKELIVVDGNITNEPGPYTVKVSITTPLDDVKFRPLSNCEVKIFEKSGQIHSLTEVEPGIYKTDSSNFKGEVGHSYRIEINTPEGDFYRSDFSEMKPLVEIDTVYGKFEKREVESEYEDDLLGYQFYISTEVADSNETYIYWDLEETFEYTADYLYAATLYMGNWEDINDNNKYFRCWKTQPVKQIFTANTLDQVKPKLTNHPLHYVSNRSKKLQLLYSLMVKQYSLNKDAFTYWNEVRKQLSGDDFLNARQPFQINGNIYNPNNKGETVLGYFNVASVSKKRIFVKPQNIRLRIIRCSVDYDYGMKMPYQLSYSRRLFFAYGEEGVGMVNEECIDCRLSGGQLKKPAFWPDNN